VVLFGEMLPEDVIDEAFRLAEWCDLLVAAGSTLEVHPIASLPEVARRAGATLAIVNRGPTAYDDACDLRIEGALGDVLAQLV
jgi:NAD-dependent deacetylase